MSAQYLLNHSTKFGRVIYDHEAICHAEKMVHCLQCQIYIVNSHTLTCMQLLKNNFRQSRGRELQYSCNIALVSGFHQCIYAIAKCHKITFKIITYEFLCILTL